MLDEEQLQWARRVLAALSDRERVPEPREYGDYSDAALAALHDRVHAAKRPGGKIKPRERWSLDEPPRGGWSVQVAPTLPRSTPVNPTKPPQYDADVSLWIAENGVTRGRTSEEQTAARIADSLGLDWHKMTPGKRLGLIRRIERIRQTMKQSQ